MGRPNLVGTSSGARSRAIALGAPGPGRSFCPTRIVAIALGLAAVADGGEVPSRVELEETLRRQWDSIETLQFRSIEEVRDRRRVEAGAKPSVWHFALGRGSRRSVQWHYDGRILYDLREDGRRAYQTEYFGGTSESVNHTSVQNQSNTRDSYKGTMNLVLWTITPAGRPLYTYIADTEGIDEIERSGMRLLRVRTKDRNRPVVLELDPAHDYLPRRVYVGDEERSLEYLVESFQRTDGRWFPKEGRLIDRMSGRADDLTTFDVESASINRPVPDALFAPPPAGEGVLVMDAVKSKATVKGGARARDALVDRYRSAEPPRGDGPATPIRVEPEGRSWLPVVVGGVSIVLVGAALVLRATRRP